MSIMLDRTGGDAPPIASVATGTAGCCAPCDIPVFCRNHYYRGKLLTEREFADEQRYLIDKARLHVTALHGWGVACGLEVKPHPYCPDLRLVIEPGLAIDACGRDIRVLKEISIDLPAPLPPAATVRPPGRVTDPASAAGPNQAQPGKPDQSGKPNPSGEDDDCGCDDTPPSQTLYLCLAYAERETEFAPAPFDDCGCNANGSLRPNRICEGYRVELYDRKPSFWDEAVGDECEAEDCRIYYRHGQQCPPVATHCCVPLAVIMDVVPGTRVVADQIRTHGYRRRIASTETIDRVVRCILEKLPPEDLTRIDDTNWEHGQRYLCREFMGQFVGTPDQHRGFRISFDAKVESRAIDTRSFQAMVVFHHDDPAQPRQMEIVPAHIEKDEDETDWCQLRIDPAYAHNRLDMRNFDLFLTLRCDVITDHRGLAVDGNFIAHRFPTGDNVQGGTFESWIRVWPRHIPA